MKWAVQFSYLYGFCTGAVTKPEPPYSAHIIYRSNVESAHCALRAGCAPRAVHVKEKHCYAYTCIGIESIIRFVLLINNNNSTNKNTGEIYKKRPYITSIHTTRTSARPRPHPNYRHTSQTVCARAISVRRLFFCVPFTESKLGTFQRFSSNFCCYSCMSDCVCVFVCFNGAIFERAFHYRPEKNRNRDVESNGMKTVSPKRAQPIAICRRQLAKN